MSPLHEFEADPFFGKAFRRIGRLAGGLIKRAAPLLKKLAPIAARIVAGAIPGVGAIAGPLAGQLVGALTQEQQHELESILHEAGAPHPEFEAVSHEAVHPENGYNPEFEAFNPEFEAFNPEMEAHHYNPEAHLYNPEAHPYNPEFEAYNPEGEIGHLEFEEEMHPEFEAEMHPEFEAGLAHSEAAHQEAFLMEQIAHEAAHSANEAEAEALAGALIPLAIRSIRAATPALRISAPALVRATGRLVGALRRSPATRPLIQTVPTILRRTNAILNRAAASGSPVTPGTAVRTMANQTYRVLASPTVCIHIIVRSGRIRRRRVRRVY
jgi:hypothetical protein